MDNRYNRHNRRKYSLKVHIILVTKYRKQLLKGSIADDVKQKIFDMTWYQKYKASVDGLLSGFLWLGYLWLLFKRAPAILNGMQLSNDEARASANVSSAPRLGIGDGFYLGGKRE